MRNALLLTITLVSLAILVGCGKQAEPPSKPTTSSSPATSKTEAPKTTGVPDFGGTTKVSREAEGIGSTPELATLAALQSAVAQANGVRAASQLQQLRAGLSVAGERSIQAEAFAQQVVTASQGAVLGYEVLSQQEVRQLDEEATARVRASDAGYRYSATASASVQANGQENGEEFGGRAEAKAKADVDRGASSYASDESYRKLSSYWKVRVRASIAQYRAPDEQGRPKIVVALPRTASARYVVGDSRVDSEEVAAAIRSRLSDELTRTKRFIVLDREFDDEVQAELDHINSGDVRVQDSAKLGQQLATDLILIPTIERFEYPRSVRHLRMSDREISSYSGGGRISLRLINVATGEVVMSQSFSHQLASTGPSTLPRVVNGRSMAANMMDALSDQIGRAIITEIFPVSVVTLKGNQVVLSQGGESLEVGQRWQAVYLGEELKDPQTGRSLGREETPCCTIRIDRVASRTSYGTVEGDQVPSAADFRPGAIELRTLAAKVKDAKATGASASGGSSTVAGTRKPRKARASETASAAKEDPNW